MQIYYIIKLKRSFCSSKEITKQKISTPHIFFSSYSLLSKGEQRQLRTYEYVHYIRVLRLSLSKKNRPLSRSRAFDARSNFESFWHLMYSDAFGSISFSGLYCDARRSLYQEQEQCITLLLWEMQRASSHLWKLMFYKRLKHIAKGFFLLFFSFFY